MPRIHDQAICLRDYDWSETSQIVVLLTREHGMVRGVAKGSRRQSPSTVQRFSGGIDLLTGGQIVATWRSGQDLATITEWDLQQTYPRLRRDLLSQHAAMYAAQLVTLLFAEHDPHPQLFDAMLRMLADLDASHGVDSALLVFQWQLLCEAGLQPQFERDVRTSAPLSVQPQYRFDPHAGGLTEHDGNAAWKVRRQTVEQLRVVARIPDDGRPDHPLNHDPETTRRANRLLAAYLRYHCDRELAGDWMQRPVTDTPRT